MSKDFSHLRHWLTGEGYSPSYILRPVVLECVVSRSGLSMSVYDRDQLLYRVPAAACGGGTGKALAEFLEALYQPELRNLDEETELGTRDGFHAYASHVSLNGCCGFESMDAVADAIGLSVQVHETRSSTLLIIQKVAK